MKYDFVDIGCCFYDTLLDEYGLESCGLLVEPIPEYYNVLPYSKTVKKECCAISNINGNISFTAFVEENVKYLTNKEMKIIQNSDNKFKKFIDENGYKFLGGHSSIFKNKINKDVLKVSKNTKNINVLSMKFKKLCEKYKISEIDKLKIDVEGCEKFILKDILYLISNNLIKINYIIYEYNHLSDLKVLDKINNIFINKFNYNLKLKKEGWNTDIHLIKK